MADREKVIRGLKCCQTINEYCDDCPYNRISYDQCTKVLTKEALELLEEQKQALKREYMRGYDKAWDEIGGR